MFFDYPNFVDYELFETRYEEVQNILNEMTVEETENVEDCV